MAETLERFGRRTETHTATIRKDDARPLGLEAWYARHYAAFWFATNFSMLALVLAHFFTSIPARPLITWSAFVAMNALLYPVLARYVPREAESGAGASHVLHIGFAAIFGLTWGLAPCLFGPRLAPEALTTLALLVSFVALAAVPVFGVYRHACPAFFAAFIVPYGQGLLTRDAGSGAALAIGVLLLLALSAVSFERVNVRSLRALRRFVQAVEGCKLCLDDIEVEDADFANRAVTHGIALEVRLREHDADARVLHDLPEAVVRTNARGAVEYMNPAAEILTGMSWRQARGESLERVVHLLAPSESSLMRRLMERCAQQDQAQANDVAATLVRADGAQCTVEAVVSPLRGEYPGLLCVFRDTGTRRRMEEATLLRATRDPLTGLANRFEFAAALKKLVADPSAAPETRHAVCLFDLDQFIQLNDTFGSTAGDAMLTHIAGLLERKLREADLVARTGDDEFGLLLYGCTLDKARSLAEGLCREIAAQPLAWHGTSLTVRASAGVIEVSPATSSLTDILGAVESACAAARRAGGNQVQTFGADDEFMRGRLERQTRVGFVQSALRDESFELWFQSASPRNSGGKGARYGEVLLRLRLANGDLLRPAEFLPVAERYHLLPDIDRWVLKTALAAMGRGDATLAGVDVVAFNVSAQTVRDEGFVDFVRALAEEHGIPGERLCFELAESELQACAARAFCFVAQIKAFGCQVALDDFGAGGGSAQLLKRLHVDYVKLAPGLVHELAHDPIDHEIALSVCRIAKQLRVRVIAEGVNNDATRQALSGLGIDLMQGHLFRRPEPLPIRPAML